MIQNGFGKADTTLEDEYEYEDEMDESNYDEEYDPWIIIGGLPPLRSCVPKNRPRLLPPKSAVHVNKNTLVLDLDETLVHSDLEQSAGKAADFSFPVHFNNQRHVVNVKKRPFLAEFMTFAARHFEVVVFTASQRVYAERLLDTLDPDAVLVKHRLYREACVLVDGNYMKDLSAIGRDLATTVIVDNSPQAFGFQTENGVPIESWFDDPNDAQLLKLIPLLARLETLPRSRLPLSEPHAKADRRRAVRSLRTITGSPAPRTGPWQSGTRNASARRKRGSTRTASRTSSRPRDSPTRTPIGRRDNVRRRKRRLESANATMAASVAWRAG